MAIKSSIDARNETPVSHQPLVARRLLASSRDLVCLACGYGPFPGLNDAAQQEGSTAVGSLCRACGSDTTARAEQFGRLGDGRLVLVTGPDDD